MKLYLVLFFLTGSLVMMVVMAKTGSSLKTPSTPHGILDLEFAYNSTKVDKVVYAWTTSGTTDIMAAARLNTGLDFIFLFFYAGFLFLAARGISSLYRGGFGKAGKLIGKGALLAGFLDILENTGMLVSLSGQGSGGIAFGTTLCSVIKWSLALLALLYVLTGTVGLLRTRLRK